MRALGFYPTNKEELINQIKRFLVSKKIIENVKGLILPHAGYPFSGSVLGKTLASTNIETKNIVIFGPNHTGMDTFLDNGEWRTPLGKVNINENVNMEKHPSQEHSIEVILPFLQYKLKNFTLTPIVMGQINHEEIEKIANKLYNTDSFFIASSDFFHYGPNFGYDPKPGTMEDKLKWVKEKDDGLSKLITNIKPKPFYNKVENNNYTVCGYRPITLLLLLMKKLNVEKGIRMDYKTSYDIQKNSSFVSYQGFAFV